jgi:hypothetical protein
LRRRERQIDSTGREGKDNKKVHGDMKCVCEREIERERERERERE